MKCERCLREFKEDDDLDVTIDKEGGVTCSECLAEEQAYHADMWLHSRDPWAEDDKHERDCRCDDCNDGRVNEAEHKYDLEMGK